MKITERDIFNYIFYPDLVREEIKEFLSSIAETSEEVRFYRDLKISLNQPLEKNVKYKIADKISTYKLADTITLFPMHNPLKERKHDSFVLAAASENNTSPKMVTKTFVDDGKDYLIKVLTYGNTTKIFIFSTHDEVIKDFHIVVEPQNLRFHLKDNTEPLKIDQAIEADLVRIEL